MSRTRALGAVLVAGALLAALLAPVGAPPAGAIPPPVQLPSSFTPVRHRAPVQAPVVDPFRPPGTRYGPGNRGLEYATTPGTAVLASAPGIVTFAGQVGGIHHVVVAHADGLRTTYGQLARIEVRAGQSVAARSVVGRSGSRLHFGVRLGDVYLDPAVVLRDGLGVRVRLVGGPLRPGMMDELERQWRAGLGTGMTFGAFLDAAGRAIASQLDPAAQWERIEAVTQIAVGVMRVVSAYEMGRVVGTWLNQRDRCTPEGVAPPVGPNRHHLVVLVAGFGSTSAPGAGIDDLDLAALGYDPARVARFSYAGGIVPDPSDGAAFGALARRAYDEADSQIALDEAAARLRALLAELALAHPGVPIDVVGHSQGGVVAVRAAQDLGVGLPLPPDLSVVTIASPHRGSTAAGALGLVQSNIAGGLGLDGLGALAPGSLGQFDPDSEAAQDLRPTSDFIGDYRRRALEPGVDVTSIGGRFDLLVPSGDSGYARGTEVVVGGLGTVLANHGGSPADPAVQREVGLALHGMHPTCQSLPQALFDHLVGNGISDMWEAAGLLSLRLP